MIEREATTIHGPLAHDGSIAFPRMWTGDDTLLVLYFGMSVKDTLKTWSVMETLISTVGFAFVLLASVVV